MDFRIRSRSHTGGWLTVVCGKEAVVDDDDNDDEWRKVLFISV